MKAVILFAALAASGTCAAAQQGSTEWRTKPAESRFRSDDPTEAQRELASYAKCVASFRYDRARAVVSARYGSTEQAEAAARVTMSDDDSCMSMRFGEARMRFSGEVLAGALAQALILKDYPDLAAILARPAAMAADDATQVAQLNPAEAFGRCVVQRDPGNAFALFAARPGTAAEDRAMAGVGDDLGPCLAAGSTLRVNRMFIRAVSGVAAYRLAQQVEARGHARAGRGAP